MNITTEKLMDWAIDKIKSEYYDDVALLIGVEGYNINNDGHGECFDYFVPVTNRGNELSQTFIINGIGYDLYPRSWERTERTASLDDTGTLCLANAKILYSRSSEDTERFESIRQKLFDNLSDSAFVYRKALEKLDIAMDLYRTMMFEDKLYKIKMAAGFIAHYLSLSVMYLNGTYEKNWKESKIPHLFERFDSIPDNFIEYYQAVICADSEVELKNLAHLLIATSRKFIAKYKVTNDIPAKERDFTKLADWYQECCLYLRRIYYYCDINDSTAAFAAACGIQSELNIIKDEFGLHEMDMLSCFDAANLEAFAKNTKELEEYIISEIALHGIAIKDYKTLEDFLSAN